MKVKNIEGLTEDLVCVYNDLREQKIGKSHAKELANVAGKLISASKTKMEYNKMTGSKNPIKFLEDAD